jgi:hypothetical protein
MPMNDETPALLVRVSALEKALHRASRASLHAWPWPLDDDERDSPWPFGHSGSDDGWQQQFNDAR